MERVTGSEHWIIPSAEVYVHNEVQAARSSVEDSMESDFLSNSESSNYEEFGPLVHLMADPTIEEVWINSPHRVFIARAGVSQLTNVVMSSQGVRDLVERLLMWGGRRLDLSHPFVDARLPDGSRLHVAIPEVTATHWAVNIRKHLIREKSLSDLADLGVMTQEMATFLGEAVASGLNILVSGSTQAGKTTLLNALVSATPNHLRVVTIEEVFELKPRLPDCIALQTRPANLQGEGEIPLRKLIKEALRMRPSQLVVGEIREAEALDLLIALNSGLPGMATIHANSARDAIAKLQTLPLLAGGNISYEFVAPIVASTIDIVVHTTILRSTGARHVSEIAHVTGRTENDRVEVEPLFTFDGEKYQRGLLDPFKLVDSENLRAQGATSSRTTSEVPHQELMPEREYGLIAPREQSLISRRNGSLVRREQSPIPGESRLISSNEVGQIPAQEITALTPLSDYLPDTVVEFERRLVSRASVSGVTFTQNQQVALSQRTSQSQRASQSEQPSQGQRTSQIEQPSQSQRAPQIEQPSQSQRAPQSQLPNQRPWILPDDGRHK